MLKCSDTYLSIIVVYRHLAGASVIAQTAHSSHTHWTKKTEQNDFNQSSQISQSAQTMQQTQNHNMAGDSCRHKNLT